MLTFKLISTTFFAVLLAGLVPFASTEISFGEFMEQLEKHLNRNEKALNFNMSFYALRDLESASDEFQTRCLYNADRKGPFETPATFVEDSIRYIFFLYKDWREERIAEMLTEIERCDPIGFTASLRKKNVNKEDEEFNNCVKTYKDFMRNRVALLDTHKIEASMNDSSISTEYAPVITEGFNVFIKIAESVSNKKMYPIDTKVNEYKKYKYTNCNDVQIIGAEKIIDGTNSSMWRAICIKYDASTEKVHIYDSANSGELDDRHKAIIKKLYPKRAHKFENPTGHKTEKNCGIFAIAYATMLILGRDSATNSIMLNEVYGDESLFIRLRIISMIYNNELILPKIEEIHPN